MRCHATTALGAALHLVLVAACSADQPQEGPASMRKLKFAATGPAQVLAWQESARTLLLDLMHLTDLVKADRRRPSGEPGLPFHAEVRSTATEHLFTRYDLQIDSTPGRRLSAILTVPNGEGRFPAVVCIHGHGGNRAVVYDPKTIYRGFAQELAQRGYVTISTDVGRHEVYEEGRTLMGERLWDLIRCIDYLTTRPEVDADRIGCAGLSLGGEMALWLGAMDTRVRATVSAGFLTTMANMRHDHCMCWEFPGLAEHFDWPDIYCLIGPRPLLCQNGRQEPANGGFPVAIAEQAMHEIRACYKVLGSEEKAALAVHPGGHVFDLASGLKFLDTVLHPQAGSRSAGNKPR